MKAIKKPIEVLAKRYTKDSDLDSLLNLLGSNKNEPVRFEESTGDLFIQKDNFRKLYYFRGKHRPMFLVYRPRNLFRNLFFFS